MNNQYNPLDINFVCAGHGFLLFGNHNIQRYHGSGSNRYGQLANNKAWIVKITYDLYEINYFKNHNIKIRKVITNNDSHSVFWLTDDNKVYGTGKMITLDINWASM